MQASGDAYNGALLAWGKRLWVWNHLHEVEFRVVEVLQNAATITHSAHLTCDTAEAVIGFGEGIASIERLLESLWRHITIGVGNYYFTTIRKSASDANSMTIKKSYRE